MPHKQVLFRSVAREKLLRGATQLADAVRVTLGPKSKSVLLQRKWGAPIVCNDGVTIAKEFDLKDAEENLGAQMLRQAAEKTGEAVGDGTSTATLLAHAIFADGVRNVVAGASAIDLKRGLERGVKAAIEDLKAISRPVAARKEKGAGVEWEPGQGRRGLWEATPVPWALEDPAAIQQSREALEVLQAALDGLPDAQRRVVLLRDVEGMQAVDVCNVLDLSETNQRVLLHRGRARLRRALDQYVRDGARPPSPAARGAAGGMR